MNSVDLLSLATKRRLDAMVKTHVQASRRYRTVVPVGDCTMTGQTMELTQAEFSYWRSQGGSTRRPTEELYPLACEIAKVLVGLGFRGSTVRNDTGELIVRCHHCKAYQDENRVWQHSDRCKRVEQEERYPATSLWMRLRG